MSNICSLSLCELETSLKKKELSVQAAVEACLDRIKSTEPAIGALLHVNAENAIKRAKELDRVGPDPHHPLWGVPIVVKDAISTKDQPTTSASRILENFIPIYDAFVIEKLKDAGAIIMGKANMDEFAMGSSTENSAFQKTRNPWDISRVPGGSSGGSAASVAAGQCFAALGSDTGGSIRQPAAFCGCVGLKPTYGRVSRYGLFAFASSLDQIGPMARTVEDCALVMNVIAGYDPRDNTSENIQAEDYMAAVRQFRRENSLKGIRIGVPRAFFENGPDKEVEAACMEALDAAGGLGAEFVDIELPDPDIASAVYYIIAMAEASSNLARYDGIRYGRRAAGVSSLDALYTESRSQGFGQEVKRRIMLGSYVLSSGYYDAYFKKAAQTRRIIYDRYVEALSECDAICMPVTPVTAWKLGSHVQDPLRMYLMDAYTLPINLAGLPSLSLPVGRGAQTGMPVGLQIVGRHFGESQILGIASVLEANLPALGEPPIANS